MIKKVLTLLLILLVCGCTEGYSLYQQLYELGYKQEEVNEIVELSNDKIELFLDEYNANLLPLVKDKRFNKSKLSDYLSYYKDYDIDTLFELVNGNYINSKDWEYVKKLLKRKFFIIDNLNMYLKYSKDIEDIDHLIGYVNVGAYKKPFEECVNADTSDEMSALGNKWSYLGKYEPSDLEVIDKKYGNPNFDQPLKKDAYAAFLKMHDAALEKGISIYVASAYRSHDYQIKIYNGYLLRDSQEVVDTYSSRPGYSDHQTGLACDLLSYGYNFDTFESSEAFKWLSENAEKYGFILRYPKDKEDITGYIYESWHYRYVGEEVAKLINDNNLTYDEYHAYYVERGVTQENTSTSTLSIKGTE